MSQEGILQNVFGYSSFRPNQKEAIDAVVAGKDCVVVLPTGGGKSLCYQIPALAQEGLAIVISPLIALMKDQVDALQAAGVSAAYWNSTLSSQEVSWLVTELRQGSVKLLYVAPERFSAPNFLELLQTLEISLFAVDEAHCISEWGHDFRPDYRNLALIRKEFPEVPIIALTATATRRVESDIGKSLNLSQPVMVHGSFDRRNLFYEVRPKGETYGQIRRYLKSQDRGSGIIYCGSRKRVDALAAKLAGDGFAALPYHAGLPEGVRARAQDRFLKDEVQIMVATVAFGMGVDKPNIRFVIHHDLPKSMESYYQETGRAGRDGLASECLLFFSHGDRFLIESLLDNCEDAQERDRQHQKFREFISYVQGHRCRRKGLLGYFGETYPRPSCGNCDVCGREEQMRDATDLSYKVLSAVVRMEQRFGLALVIQVLRGSQAEKVSQQGFDKLSLFGICKAHSAAFLRRVIEELLREGYLEQTEDSFPVLRLTPRAIHTLKKREKIFLPLPEEAEPEPKERVRQKDLEYDEGLFEILKKRRSDLAKERNVPPYVILSDRTLQEMAYYLPQSEESFRNISGVGEHKWQVFGKTFLNLIQGYARDKRLQERAVPAKRAKASETQGLPDKAYSLRDLMAMGWTMEEASEKLKVQPATAEKYLAGLLEAGKITDVSKWVEERVLAEVQKVMEEDPHVYLRTLREALEGRGLGEVDWLALRLAQAHCRFLLKQGQPLPS